LILFENLNGTLVTIKKLIWIISIIFMTACAKTIPAVKIAEEPMVQDCTYLATLSETTDPGRRLDNYRPPEHQDEIFERAANLGATHIVWVYDFRIGSAAVAYRCDH
jgi:hypothetical protein